MLNSYYRKWNFCHLAVKFWNSAFCGKSILNNKNQSSLQKVTIFSICINTLVPTPWIKAKCRQYGGYYIYSWCFDTVNLDENYAGDVLICFDKFQAVKVAFYQISTFWIWWLSNMCRIRYGRSIQIDLEDKTSWAVGADSTTSWAVGMDSMNSWVVEMESTTSCYRVNYRTWPSVLNAKLRAPRMFPVPQLMFQFYLVLGF